MHRVLEIVGLSLLAVACGAEAQTEAVPGAGGGTALPCSLTVKLLDFKLEPADVEAKSGHVELCAENGGKTPHDIAVRDASNVPLGRTPTLNPGDSAHVSLDLTAGTYGIYCAEAGHESLGMHGTLTVR